MTAIATHARALAAVVLAEALPDNPHLRDADIDVLAQEIREAVERYLEYELPLRIASRKRPDHP